ncbi:MAG: peptide deformylase [Actinomycetota bacterium]|jgi:peptide deformylase|nr:peptide deformylase [Actinomycetota bacterium]
MKILTHPSPVLKLNAHVVEPTQDSELRSLVRRMAQTMYDAPGIGLAAPQVGVQKRVIVYDLDDGLVALCNPRIVSRSDETEIVDEACLSVPGIVVDVERSLEVTCEALDLDGGPVEITAQGLHARLLLHEIDHLDGVLILDRAAPEERKIATRRYMEAREESA